LKGSSWVVDKYELDPDILNYIEENGNLYANEDPDLAMVLSAIPRSLYDLGRKGFGIIGGGNHFLELQVIEDIIDAAICEKLQLRENQIAVMFHTGSDAFGALVGRYFARRKRTLGKFQKKLSLQKVLFHLLSSKSLSNIWERWEYYFSDRVHISIPMCSDEGYRCMLSVKASANYGYANRTAVMAAIKWSFESVLNSKSFHLSILYDLSHNSIFEEEVDEEKLWVHRHNSCRVFPPSEISPGSIFHSTGQPVLLPGSNRTSSYICVGGEGAIDSLCSIDHGAGKMIDRFEGSGRCKTLRDGKITKLYRYNSSNATDIPHLSDEGINEVIAIMSSNNIVKPVARLRPIAVLKG
jgi:tRNA-splicing ligase RtcB